MIPAPCASAQPGVHPNAVLMIGMRHKWILGIGLVVVTVPFAAIMIGRARAEAAFQAQLRLARSEGIPTNGREYAATIPAARPEENAAPIYRSLPERSSEGDWARKLEVLLIKDGASRLGEAEAFLRKNEATYKAIDEAAALPRCWFDRDWTDGPAVMMPEFMLVKRSARLLALRGSVAATRGDHAAALRDVDRIFRLADHGGEEGHFISRSLADAIRTLGLRRLAIWGSLHRDRKEYRAALAKALGEDPKADLQREHASDLYSHLWLIENLQTPEGLEKIGLKEEDIPKAAKILPLFMNEGEARIALVAAERKLWSAYGSDSPDPAAIETIRRDRLMALFAFPGAPDLSESLMPQDFDETSTQRRITRRLTYTALLRVIEGPAVPRKIKTNDLLSPFDGKPLRYRFDGKQITLDVGRPPDPELPSVLTVPVRSGRVLAFNSL